MQSQLSSQLVSLLEVEEKTGTWWHNYAGSKVKLLILSSVYWYTALANVIQCSKQREYCTIRTWLNLLHTSSSTEASWNKTFSPNVAIANWVDGAKGLQTAALTFAYSSIQFRNHISVTVVNIPCYQVCFHFCSLLSQDSQVTEGSGTQS